MWLCTLSIWKSSSIPFKSHNKRFSKLVLSAFDQSTLYENNNRLAVSTQRFTSMAKTSGAKYESALGMLWSCRATELICVFRPRRPLRKTRKMLLCLTPRRMPDKDCPRRQTSSQSDLSIKIERYFKHLAPWWCWWWCWCLCLQASSGVLLPPVLQD